MDNVRGGTDAAGYKPHDVCMLTVHIAQLAYKLEGQKLTRTSISELPSLAGWLGNVPVGFKNWRRFSKITFLKNGRQ